MTQGASHPPHTHHIGSRGSWHTAIVVIARSSGTTRVSHTCRACTRHALQVNGRSMVRTNPYSIRSDGEDDLQESYIYKSDK
jgi:hypothetical protein